MSRLIDADELIEFLKEVTVTDGITFETGFKQILTDIKNQPTIYDVDEIVEQLKGMSGVQYDCDKCGTRWEVHDCIYTKNAIEIVKRGIKNE